MGREQPRRGTPADLLVVGLGNPGAQYAHTRHNIGVEVVEQLCAQGQERLKASKNQALEAELRIEGKRVAVAFPQTYMNESGRSVQLLVHRYGIDDLARLVVVHDELDLDVGRIKLKMGGGLAGHNGLKSIKAHLGTPDFGRIRIGVGKPPGRQAGADFVLRRPGKAEQDELNVVVTEAVDAVGMIVTHGFAAAMNRYNTRE